ncbi:MAG TPA: TonB-dependent receptor [Polyangiaceae bacterium]|nr:TonB-dependent receptor [Polyangiaceae bacterium]
MTARRLASIAAAVAAAVTCPEARAGGQDLEGLLNESVVTAASQITETGRDAPATSTVITGEELRRYGVRSLAEALSFLALGTSAGQPTGATTELGARGITISGSNWEHFLLIVDGARQNGVFFGEAEFGPAAVPIEIVDHIEVILGPGSVLYGSNAMLGVINVVTKSAKDFGGLRLGVESAVWTSARPWASYGGSLDIGGTRAEVTAEIEYFRQWGPSLHFDPVYGGVDPATKLPYRYTTAPVGTGVWGGADSSSLTQADSPSAVGRVRLGKFELSFQGQVANEPIRASVVDFDTRAFEVNRRLLVNLAYADQLTPMLALKAHAYLNASDQSTTIYTSWAPECLDVRAVCRNVITTEGVAAGVEATPSFDWAHDGTIVTLAGVDAVARSGRSIFNQFDATTGAVISPSTGLVDHRDGALGAYVQQTWSPSRWLGLNAGGRLDYDPRFSPVVSPRVAARVDPWSNGTVKAIYSEAFRAPSFFESYFSHALNPLPDNLQPERGRSGEASIEQRFGAQRLLFGVFGAQWTNLISYYNFSSAEAEAYVAEGKALLPPLYQYRNLASVSSTGYNAAYEGTLLSGALEYGVAVTGAVARLQNPAGSATPLTVSPRVFGNAHASYRLPAPLPNVAIVAVGQGARPAEDAFSAGFRPIPYVPARLDLQLTLTGAVPGVSGLSYRLAGFWTTADHEPYLAGPNVSPSAQYTSPSLVPVERTRVVVGLEYRFNP